MTIEEDEINEKITRGYQRLGPNIGKCSTITYLFPVLYPPLTGDKSYKTDKEFERAEK